jgi:predicted RNA-binding Zn-ribbon protein involved in translation (DUF1610 family)
MPELVESINCPHCGGPLNLTTGEVIVTCPYCGSAVRVRSDKPFLLRHSMLPGRIDRNGALQQIEGWMAGGIMKPDDLRRGSRIVSLDGFYLPFYVFEVDASTAYQGVLTRTGTNERRSGNLVRNYFWKILGRRSGDYQIADYHIPLTLKVPFDTTQMLKDARMLNAEVDEDEAGRIAQEEVDAHQRELLKDLVDVLENANTQVTVKDTEFIHAPLWFGTFQYRGKDYEIVVDGASGDVVRGDIPGYSGGLGEFLKDSTHGIFRH